MQRVDIGRVLNEFPGQTFNELIDEAERSIREGGTPQPPTGQGVNGSGLTIRVKNATSEHLQYGYVLGCGDPFNQPSTATENGNQYRPPILNGVTPNSITHASKFVIAQSSVQPNGGVDGLKLGFTFVKVSFTDSSHGFAKVKDGEVEHLASAASGAAEIWWCEDASGATAEDPVVVWALVLLGGGGGGNLTVSFYVVVGGMIGAGTGDTDEITPAEGTVQRYITAPDGKRTPTDDDPIDVFNYDPAATYSVGAIVYISTENGAETPEIVSGSCGVYPAPTP